MDPRHPSRRMVVRDQLFLVKFHGYDTQEGAVGWQAVTVVSRDDAGRVIPGDEVTVDKAGLAYQGSSPDEAFQGLQSKLIEMKSYEV